MRAWLLSLTLPLTLLLSGLSTPQPAAPQPPPPPIVLPLVAQAYDSTWPQAEPISVTLTPAPQGSPQLLSDASERLHILWDTDNSSGAFIYHRYQVGSGWSVPAPIAPTLGFSELIIPPLATPDGHIHLVWANKLTSSGPFRLLSASFDGHTWSGETELARITGYYAFTRGALTCDPQGNLHLVYTIPGMITNRYVYQRRSTAGWEAPRDITPTQPASGVFWRHILPDPQGGVHFYGYLYLDNRYLSLVWRDGVFQGEPQPLAAEVWDQQASLDLHGGFHQFRSATIPIPGGSVTGLQHQCRDAAGQWGPVQVWSGEEAVSGGVVLGGGRGARLAAVWGVDGQPQLNVALISDCEAQAQPPLAPPAWVSRAVASVTLRDTPDQLCALFGSYGPTYHLLCSRLAS